MKANLSSAALVAIVDDDAAILAAMKGLVESFGYDVATFGSADAFLASDALAKARCLILDVQMPKTSGPALYRRLRAAGRTTPVIFVTAFPDRRVEAQLLESGAIAYLAKPFAGETLRLSIQRALGTAPKDGNDDDGAP